MAGVTDRARGRTQPKQGRHHATSLIRVTLGTQTEAVSAANFGLKTLYAVFSTDNRFGGSSGTAVQVTVRNPGSVNARASVQAIGLTAKGNGTLTYHRKVAGTIGVELLAIGD